MTQLSNNHKLTAIQQIIYQDEVVLKWIPTSKQIADIIKTITTSHHITKQRLDIKQTIA